VPEAAWLRAINDRQKCHYRVAGSAITATVSIMLLLLLDCRASSRWAAALLALMLRLALAIFLGRLY
jgi:hypothetical protein